MMIFVIGLFPNIFLAQIKGAAERIETDFDARIEREPAAEVLRRADQAPARAAPRPRTPLMPRRRACAPGAQLSHDARARSLPVPRHRLGALLLMLAEAFSPQNKRADGGLALGAAIVLFAGAAFAAGVWMFGIDQLPETAVGRALAAASIASRSSSTCCSASAARSPRSWPAGTSPEHNLERGEFYALLLFSTLGAMMLAAAGDVLTLFLGLETMSHRRLRDDGVPPRARRVGRRRAQVLPARLLRRGAPALRLRAALRRDRAHRSRGHRRRRSPARRRRKSRCVIIGARAGARRARLQGERGALPHVDARRLRGRAHAGDDVHGRRREERRRSRCCCACSCSRFGDATLASWAAAGRRSSRCSPC